jgi:hypothetical protein
MATLAKAEKAELMEYNLKSKIQEKGRHDSDSDSDRSKDRSNVGSKRTNYDRRQEEARRDREAVNAQRRREIIREDRMERAGLKKSKTERE